MSIKNPTNDASGNEAATPPPPSLPGGYFLGQEAASLPRSALFRTRDPYLKRWGDKDEVKRYFETIAGRVDGLDFIPFWYEPADAENARMVAEIGRSFGVDLWTGPRFTKQFRDHPPVPPEYAAWAMAESGHLYPAMWEIRSHFRDVLNPAALDWMLDVLDERFWSAMGGLVNGWFVPELRVPTYDVPYDGQRTRSESLLCYSPYVLAKWREYCVRRDVRHQGALVDRFPVSKPSMVPKEDTVIPVPSGDWGGILAKGGLTVHIPDDRPLKVPSYTRFADIPRENGVWTAWEDFLCESFASVMRHLAQRLNRRRLTHPDWRGICYFNNDVTMLDYRFFTTRSMRTTCGRGYWPQGMSMGVDVRRLMKDPQITCFITEVIESVRTYLFYDENCLSVGMDLAKTHGRERDYGFMVHYSDEWGHIGNYSRTPGGAIMDDIEEDLRWQMINKYRPPVISFYSIPAVLMPDGAYYNREAAERFWRRVEEYKLSWR